MGSALGGGYGRPPRKLRVACRYCGRPTTAPDRVCGSGVCKHEHANRNTVLPPVKPLGLRLR